MTANLCLSVKSLQPSPGLIWRLAAVQLFGDLERPRRRQLKKGGSAEVALEPHLAYGMGIQDHYVVIA